MTEGEDLDQQVRRGDGDRWLASRFVADPARRAELTALYALNLELARVAPGLSNPLMGEIRFAWWREGLDALFDGAPGRAPVLQALSKAAGEGRLDRAALERLIEARHADLQPAPFSDEPTLVEYLDGTAGAVMSAAARLLDSTANPASIQGAARAWGWASLLRAAPALEAQGRSWLPTAWGEPNAEDLARHVAHRIADALREASGEVRGLSVAAFPAAAYATLAQPYGQGRSPGDLERRLRLTWAVTRGRL